MLQVGGIDTYKVYVLDKETAKKYIADLLHLFNEIPQVTYSEEEILADQKGERLMYGKWEHSLIVFDKDVPIVIIAGYERKSEHNDQYPDNTIYINELAVKELYQKKGIGRKLLAFFLGFNAKIGFKHLSGDLNFSVQTNVAEWNIHVQNLYKSFGFTKRGTKPYENRTDIILGWKPN